MSTDTANCMCRVISVEVEREPRLRWDLSLQVCCAWPASPVNGVAIWPRDKVRITKPEDQIDSYASSEGHQRAWCKKCGGHVFHDVGPFGVVDEYASLVQGPSSSRRFI